MKEPLNLRQLFGDRFKIELDDVYSGRPNSQGDPWYYLIPCKYGHIYPYSDRLLAYYCVGERVRAKLRREHPELECRQWSDDGECVFLFEPDQIDIIADHAQPHRKRRSLTQRNNRDSAAGCEIWMDGRPVIWKWSDSEICVHCTAQQRDELLKLEGSRKHGTYNDPDGPRTYDIIVPESARSAARQILGHGHEKHQKTPIERQQLRNQKRSWASDNQRTEAILSPQAVRRR